MTGLSFFARLTAEGRLAMHDPLVERWLEAARDLHLEIEAPFSVALQSGAVVGARFQVKHFGAPKGMLVVTDSSNVVPFIDDIIAAGYGFSVLSDPRQSEPYEREDFIEVLRDWGWSGSEEARPVWCLPLDDLDDDESDDAP